MSIDLIKRHFVSCNSYAYCRGLWTFLLCIFFVGSVFSQKPAWAELMYSENATVKKVSKAYDAYYLEHEFVKNKFTQDYKRFIRSKTREAFDDANISTLRNNQKLYTSTLLSNAYRENEADWKPLGPFDIDLTSAAVGATPGLAHVYTVEKDNFLVAGTATSGAWKSTDNGNSWTSLTHDLLVTEVKAVEVDGNTILFGGNGHIYRSLDGGNSWQETGSSTFKSQYHRTLEIARTSEAYLAATNLGLYKSDDFGATWTQIVSGSFQEIEVHPTNDNIIYAIQQVGSGTAFFKSTDGGDSFVSITNGYPVISSGQEQLRTEIAVSPAEPNKIVALATGEANGGSGLFGIYVSEDAGESWSFKCCGTGPGGAASANNKNIMAWQASGQVSGGQYYYDVALAISQTDANEIYAGGINIWKSTDGGANFVNNADYVFGSAGQRYVHADIQDIRVYEDEIWVATDGGIFMSKNGGASFEKRMAGIVGTDFRGFGAGSKDGEVLIGGTYHNGTLIKENNTYDAGWVSTYSGDNAHGQVNPQNNRITYSDIGILTLPGNASTVPSLQSLTIKPNSSYKTGESSEYVFHPSNANTFFLGSGGSLYKTVDNGKNFTQLKNFGSGKVTKIEIAPSNPDVIYAVYYPNYNDHKKLYRSINGGNTWEDISPFRALFGNSKLWIAWDIAVSSSSEDELWLARTPQTSSSATTNGKQVFHTTDGGNSWSNITDPTLNGELITNIVHQKGTNGGVYIGTRRTVYYKNADMESWQLFKSGLPALTYSTNLVILYEQERIVNATHRGVYASDLFEVPFKEVSFQVDKNEGLCQNDVFQFSNSSTGFANNAIVKWTFENAEPAVSYDENPVVRFNGVGGHSVTLEVTEGSIPYQKSESNFITILDECVTEPMPGSALRTYNNNFLIIPALELETNTITFSAWIKREGNTKDNAGIILMRQFGILTGLNMTSNGELKYYWGESGSGNLSGLTVKKDKWTHVAMSVSPNEISIYVDGIERSFPGNYPAILFDKELLIGKDMAAFTYYFNGYFDELSIFDKSLTTFEVRSHMNLVKDNVELPEIHNYFQFNDEGTIAKDIIGSKHASFFANPDYVESMAPIGRGNSQIKSVVDLGMHEFEDVNVSLKINSGISCDSDLGVYRIERNVSGSSDAHNSDYLYIVNHFSEDEFVINGELAISSAFDIIDESSVKEDSFKLYQLDFDEAPMWDENERTNSLDFNHEENDKIVFEVSEEKQMEGKFLVSYNPVNSSLAISDIYFDLKMHRPGEVDVQWFLHPEDHFIRTELQRSGDGRRFETIHTLDNKLGQLAFQYIDQNPLKGRNYYRVKMTYDDLSTDFSKIDDIRVTSESINDFLYPNPISSSNELAIKDVDLEGAQLSIYDMSGRKLEFFNNIESGRVDVSNLSAGSYLVVIEERTDRKQQILIKEGL